MALRLDALHEGDQPVRRAHFDGLLKNPFAGRLRKSFGIVDGLGHSVAGDAQFICDILYGDFFHLRFLLGGTVVL